MKCMAGLLITMQLVTFLTGVQEKVLFRCYQSQIINIRQ
jgi:hypothetical protein